jgi:hypothetical protein
MRHLKPFFSEKGGVKAVLEEPQNIASPKQLRLL